MEKLERTQLYDAAWEHWGSDWQLDICIEEMAEFTQAILKTRRNGVTYSYAFSEELADVCICIEQIKTRLEKFPHGQKTGFHGNMWDDQVMVIKEEKLQRLKTRLAESMAEKKHTVEDALAVSK